MGVFNNFGEYNAKEEAIRRKAVMEEFLASDKTHLVMTDEKLAATVENMDFAKTEERIIASMPAVKIENHNGFFSADCPQCGQTKILSSELNSLSAVCNKCYCAFNLEK